MLRVLSLIALLLPVGALAETSGFRVDDRMFEVPVEPGFCETTPDELSGTLLSGLLQGSIVSRLDYRAIHIDCESLDQLRAGRKTRALEMRIWGVAKVAPDSVEFPSEARVQFEAIRQAFASPQGEQARQQAVNGLRSGVTARGVQMPCASVEANDTVIGGRICMEVPRDGVSLKIDMALAAVPVRRRLLATAVILFPGGAAFRPDFQDASGMIAAMRPAR